MTAIDRTTVIVFARAPRPGAVKTRLIPALGPEGAAALHVKLVKHTLETTRAASFGAIELHCDPDADDAFFSYCSGHYGVALLAQAEGDLGARMRPACERALEEAARVLLIGTDCPALTARHLRQAERALRDGHDAVFVPCEDGGYALVGLRRVDARLFDGIAWGSDRVMAETRARLEGLGWRWHELDTLWDVDRPQDYQRLLDAGLVADAATRSRCPMP
jgi:uncharacterized protein